VHDQHAWEEYATAVADHAPPTVALTVPTPGGQQLHLVLGRRTGRPCLAHPGLWYGLTDPVTAAGFTVTGARLTSHAVTLSCASDEQAMHHQGLLWREADRAWRRYPDRFTKTLISLSAYMDALRPASYATDPATVAWSASQVGIILVTLLPYLTDLTGEQAAIVNSLAPGWTGTPIELLELLPTLTTAAA
jgi:hypothetical protein